MITCCIRYTLDPHQIAEFEEYAKRWPPIIAECGGKLIGYYLPKEGANNFAIALIDFDSLASYETYRSKLAAHKDAKANVENAKGTKCILVEERSFLRKV
ncbi:MAG TPA: NIPSNAP family protein [Acidobacteriaceae bacterium]|nr:NIPSNAP family protein [Acidobacteriaceae bacterium]